MMELHLPFGDLHPSGILVVRSVSFFVIFDLSQSKHVIYKQACLILVTEQMGEAQLSHTPSLFSFAH